MALNKRRKIVVVAGAGISVSAGIPDFRSSKGLFKSLKKQHNLKSSGKELFDASVYRDGNSTSSFHYMVRELSALSKNCQPTAFHHLLATLADEGRLLRLYTQNVDGLDTSMDPLKTTAPLPQKGPWPKTVQVHGGLQQMVCSKCNFMEELDAELFDGPEPPTCGMCEEADNARTEHAGKRSHGIGRLRPRMVLYNEHNPDDEAIGAVMKADMRTRPDCLIVVGTTLKIPGVKRFIKEVCGIVRSRRDGLTIWINQDPPP
ncbi:DHS-like NAD/FAD-binding domain-containing protein, partial [Microthyrium microscopicum]